MDLSSIYMSSPDWLKFVLVVAPCLMLYGIAHVVATSWREIALARLRSEPSTITLVPGTEQRKQLTVIED